jgi:site-specific DNA-cytosine methylase
LNASFGEKMGLENQHALHGAPMFVPHGTWWDGSDCAATLTKQNANGAQRMPDKDNLGAVLTPTAFSWQNARDGLRQDDAVAALRSSAGDSGFHEMNHPVVMQPVAVTVSNGEPRVSDCMGTLDAARESRGSNQQRFVMQPVPFRKSKRAQSTTDDAITGDVAATMGTPGSSVNASGPTVMQAVAFHPTQDPISSEDGTTHAMGCGSKGGAATVAVAQPVAHALRGEGFDASEDGTGRGTPLVPVATAVPVSDALVRGNNQYSGFPTEVVSTSAMTVRRLTPRECERLQAFPDDYTLIPWRKKPADQCPDGPRYKALGNSMAVSCMEWIGERIAAYESKERNP